jgi:hypothetical protein
MLWFNKISLTLGLFCLGACGFTPVHSNKSTQEHASLAAIDIHIPRSREGAWLQKALEDRFNPSNISISKTYTLEPTVQLNSLPVIIEPNGKIQRYRLKLSSAYVLRNNADQTIVKTGTLSRQISYNVSVSDYSTFVAPNDAIKRGIDELAADYEAYFSSYFSYKK